MSGSQPPQGKAETATTDPSMEDILASIRRILSEDEQAAADAEHDASADEFARSPMGVTVAEPATADMRSGTDEDDVLVLDASMMVANPGPEMPLVDPEPPPSPPLSPPASPDPVAAAPDPDELELLAPAAAAAATASVSGLMRTLAAERATQVHRGGATIEDLVREEIRPILKEWLDTHLPPIVERLVRAEIERVVGRAVP